MAVAAQRGEVGEPVEAEDIGEGAVGEAGVGDGGVSAEREGLRGTDGGEAGVELGVDAGDENEATESMVARSWPLSAACSRPVR